MNWEGMKAATEHRTTGSRAWCFQDGTWCYETVLCECCMEASDEFDVCPRCEGDGYVRRVPVPSDPPEET